MLTHQLKHYSEQLLQQGLYRQRQVNRGASEGWINFSSNDYLSLSSHPRLKKAYQQGFEQYPIGSGGSMLISGYHEAHQALEQAFAEALGVDDCLLFSSGYVANLSVIDLLARFDTHILIDKKMHASIYDGIKGSRAVHTRYLHNDMADVAAKVKAAPKNTVLMTEGIFSMSGACAPLSAIAQLSQQYAYDLLVDEAHAFGVLGREGLGAVVHHQLTQAEVPLRIIPLGKAFASFGAIVAGQGAWIEALLQSARPYIYSTAMSPACAHGLLETLNVMRAADTRRAKLMHLVHYFRETIARSPLKWRDSFSPIQQLQLGCPHRALHYAEALREQSMFCLAMRQPTVSKQETGLRVILNHDHEPEHIDALFHGLHQL